MNTTADELKTMTIAVLRGGRSAEREISLRTGAAILKALGEAGYRVVDLDVGRDLAEKLIALRPGLAFLALHGRGGEDGTVQGLLEYLGIPYTGSGVLASALALDKVRSKQVFAAAGIPTPRWTVARRGEPAPAPPGYPVVVKPAFEGSSLGMSIVRAPAELPAALELAARYDAEILFEEYVAGREVTVSILGNRELRLLPIVEIVPRNEFFDHEAKYTKGKTEYIVPARLSAAVAAAANEAARATYRALGCRGLGRVDIIIEPSGQPRVLELNTLPGMTETSLLPKAAAAAGLSFPALLTELLGLALAAQKEMRH